MDSESPATVRLDLSELPDACTLSRPVVEALALAAGVVLDRLHGPRDAYECTLLGPRTNRSATLNSVPIDDNARATYADPEEATEEGAEAVAILVARRVLDRIVFRRLPKGTGADYRMAPPGVQDSDSYERLECSGIGDGQETTESRLRRKLDQLARYPNCPTGTAIVTNFRIAPIEIRSGEWSK